MKWDAESTMMYESSTNNDDNGELITFIQSYMAVVLGYNIRFQCSFKDDKDPWLTEKDFFFKVWMEPVQQL